MRSGSLLHSPSGGVVAVVSGGAVVRMSGVLVDVLPVDSVKMICKTYILYKTCVLYHCTDVTHSHFIQLIGLCVDLMNLMLCTVDC